MLFLLNRRFLKPTSNTIAYFLTHQLNKNEVYLHFNDCNVNIHRLNLEVKIFPSWRSVEKTCENTSLQITAVAHGIRNGNSQNVATLPNGKRSLVRGLLFISKEKMGWTFFYNPNKLLSTIIYDNINNGESKIYVRKTSPQFKVK